MKVAIVGCGFIAGQYAQAIHASPQLDLVATMDRVPELAQRLARKHGCTPYEHLPHLLAQSEAELIVNLTTPLAHADVTHTCLAAGKHVYSEKPLAMSHDEAQALVAHARRQGVQLACAPNNLYGDAQQVAWRLMREGRLGTVRVVYADCNMGRVTQWHPNPESLLRSGPLFDGAVYPLTVLTAYFGPVVRVISAHSLDLGAASSEDAASMTAMPPPHTVALLELESGAVARLTASMYVPYQTTHWNSLEFHGDTGSLYLHNCGELGAPRDQPAIRFARIGKDYRPVPLPHRAAPRNYASAIADLADAHRRGKPQRDQAAQAAHLVEVINAIAACAETAQAVPVRSRFAPPRPLAWSSGLWPVSPLPQPSLPIPPIGFGCSRYRGGGVYVDLEAPIEDALDMGYRLFDTAELYGNEQQLGEIVRRPGSPPRQELFLVSKVWNTNHAYAHVMAACEKTLRALGVEYLDLYLIHWPHAWQYRGPLERLMSLSHEEAEALTFPQDEAGNILTSDIPLEETWQAMETLLARGWVRAIGVSNFDREHLEHLLTSAQVPPAVNQIEYHPYRRNHALVSWCKEREIAVVAHSPLSAPGLLQEPLLLTLAERYGKTPAQIVLRWYVQHGVVPLPSSTNAAHIAANLDIFHFDLSPHDMRAIDHLHQPGFRRI